MLGSKKKRANGMRSSERTIKRLGEIIAGDEAVSEDPGRLERSRWCGGRIRVRLSRHLWCAIGVSQRRNSL